MRKKDKTIFNFILKDIEIEISPMLEALIKNPQRLEALNSKALGQAVREFAPIYRKYRYTLDGSKEANTIAMFAVYLTCRLNNKPELQKMLTGC